MTEKHIYCDECKKTICLEGLIQEQTVGRDRYGDVKERFFECPVCGHHYTITVYNRPMLLKIQKRQQIQGKIRRNWGRGMEQQFKSWLAEDERLKKQLLNEAHALRRQYLKEGRK